MKIIQPKKKPILVILVKRTISFFFCLCVLIIFLYGIGSKQEFMDLTQRMLLRLAVIAGLVLGIFSWYGIILESWFVFYKKLRYKWRLFSYIMLMIFGFGAASLAAFILVLTGGNET